MGYFKKKTGAKGALGNVRRTFTILLISAFVLTGCGAVRDSRLNPFNWFGRSQEVPAAQTTEETNPLIPSNQGVFTQLFRRNDGPDLTTPIETVTDVRVERVPGGAIIRATGVDNQQGAFNVELVPSNEDELPEDGTLIYTLERQKPSVRQNTGAAQTREVVVARFVTDNTLAGVSRIRVVAVQNAREVRR